MTYWEVYFFVMLVYLRGIISTEPCNVAVTMETAPFLRKIRRNKSSKISNNFSWHWSDTLLNCTLSLLHSHFCQFFTIATCFTQKQAILIFPHINWSNISWVCSTDFSTSAVNAEQSEIGSEDTVAKRWALFTQESISSRHNFPPSILIKEKKSDKIKHHVNYTAIPFIFLHK